MSMTWIPMAERRPTAQDADAWGNEVDGIEFKEANSLCQ